MFVSKYSRRRSSSEDLYKASKSASLSLVDDRFATSEVATTSSQDLGLHRRMIKSWEDHSPSKRPKRERSPSSDPTEQRHLSTVSLGSEMTSRQSDELSDFRGQTHTEPFWDANAVQRDMVPRVPRRRFSTGSVKTEVTGGSHEATSIVSALTEPTEYVPSSEFEDGDSVMDTSSVVSGITNPTFFDGLTFEDEDEDAMSIERTNPTDLDESIGTTLSVSVSNLAEQGTSERKQEQKTAPSSSLLRFARNFRAGVKTGYHTYHFKRYNDCFVGSEAIDFLVDSGMAESREDAVFLGQRFVNELDLFHHVHWDHRLLKDDYIFYRFTDDFCISQSGNSTQSATQLSMENSTRSSTTTSSDGNPNQLLENSHTTLSTDSSAGRKQRERNLERLAVEFKSEIFVGKHIYHFKTYKDTFIGEEAVDKMIAMRMAKTRTEAVFLGQRLLEELNLFHHVNFKHTFKDANLFYRFSEIEDITQIGTQRLSLTSTSSKCDGSRSLSSGSSGPKHHSRSVGGRPLRSILKNSTEEVQSVIVVPESFGTDGGGSDSNTELAELPALPDPRFLAPIAPVRHLSITSTSLLPHSEGDQSQSVLARISDIPQMPIRHSSVGSCDGDDQRSASTRQETQERIRERSQATISFGGVQQRLFLRDLAYNPATSAGPSVGLSWKYKDLPAVSLDTHSLIEPVTPRKTRDLILSKSEREQILADCGYSGREINQVSRSNTRARTQRKETLNRLTASAMAGVDRSGRGQAE